MDKLKIEDFNAPEEEVFNFEDIYDKCFVFNGCIKPMGNNLITI